MQRLLLRVALVAAAAGVLMTAGCNDDVVVAPEEQRIAVGVSPSRACPDPETQVASATAVATVFALDGQGAEKAKVRFSSDQGAIFDPEVAETAEIGGQATSQLSIGRIDGAPVVITGTLESTGESDTQEMLVPGDSQVGFFRAILQDPPQLDPPIVGLRSATLVLQITPSCNVADIDFTLSWDPDVLELSTFPPGHESEGEPYIITNALFDQGDLTTIEPETTLDLTQEPGRIHVHYFRSDEPQTGFTFGGGQVYLTLVFDGIAEGATRFVLESFRLAPSFGPPYPISEQDVPVDQFGFVDISGGG